LVLKLHWEALWVIPSNFGLHSLSILQEPNPPMLHFHNREKLSFLSIYVVKIGTVMIDTTCIYHNVPCHIFKILGGRLSPPPHHIQDFYTTIHTIVPSLCELSLHVPMESSI
jgi:hypothetical protein